MKLNDKIHEYSLTAGNTCEFDYQSIDVRCLSMIITGVRIKEMFV